MDLGRSSFQFGRRRVGPGLPTLVIAELGINHEGDPDVCARMIEEAVKAGADAIKLQTIDPDVNYVPGTPSHALFSRAQLSNGDTRRLLQLARRLGAEAFTTAGDFATLDFIDSLEPAGHKISSGLLTHLPLIAAASATGRAVLISTGMATIDEIDKAVETARGVDGAALAILQCTSLYPAPPETLNLAAIPMLRERYGLPVGFSDHSLGITAAPLAVAAGACIIEKHFTLDARRPGFDHPISLEPGNFAEMVRAIRLAEAMRGTATKEMTPQERANAGRFRRRIVAGVPLRAGDLLTDDAVAFMRLPEDQGGLAPEAWDRLRGRQLLRDVERYEPILNEDTRAVE